MRQRPLEVAKLADEEVSGVARCPENGGAQLHGRRPDRLGLQKAIERKTQKLEVGIKDEANVVQAGVTLTRAYAIRLSDHTLVASWAAPTTNGSGQLVLSDAALTATPHLLATVSNSNADAGAKVYTPTV